MHVDYDDIAPRYDRHRGGGGPYIARLAELARRSHAARVLEIGPGTGNNTAAFLECHRCTLVGIEPSDGMLAQARAKGLAAAWVRGTAESIPLADASADLIFAIYVLHHLRNLDAVFLECVRVLRGGFAAFLTAPEDFIDHHPMNRYFPSFARVDRARFQPVAMVAAALEKAGFRHVQIERFSDAPQPIDKVYADRVASKFISTYDLLAPSEFAAGVERLYADIAARGRLQEPIVWESVLVWGSKTV